MITCLRCNHELCIMEWQDSMSLDVFASLECPSCGQEYRREKVIDEKEIFQQGIRLGRLPKIVKPDYNSWIDQELKRRSKIFSPRKMKRKRNRNR